MTCLHCQVGNCQKCAHMGCKCSCKKTGMRPAIWVLISVFEYTDGTHTAMELDKGYRPYLEDVAKKIDKQGTAGDLEKVVKQWFPKIMMQHKWHALLLKGDEDDT